MGVPPPPPGVFATVQEPLALGCLNFVLLLAYYTPFSILFGHQRPKPW